MAASPDAYTLGELAQRFGLKLQGDAQLRISGVCALDPGKAGHLCFYANPRLRTALAGTQAAAVVLSAREAQNFSGNALVSAAPELDFCRIAKLFDHSQDFTPGVHRSAVIDTEETIGAGSYIGPHVVIEAGAVIGEGCFIGPNSLVRSGAVIGAGSRLEAQVYVGERCRIGARVQVQPGAVIGGRGFGWIPSPKGWVEKPQLGTVEIGDDVEIGANTCIDRGRFAETSTVIESGAKLDNQIQIAHNCRIGANTAIAACVGIAGSTVIGRNCLIGGAVGIGDGLKIADNVYISGFTMVTKSLTAPGAYGSGLPVMPAKDWRKLVARVRRLPQLEQRLALIEQELKLQPTQGDASEPDDF